MLVNPLTLHLPATVSEAAKLYQTLNDFRVLAGGSFLLNNLKYLKVKGNKTPAHILSLAKIDALKSIRVEGDSLIIGAMTTITDLFESPLLVDNWSIIKTVCRNISTTPIRNMASVGGNLTCRYTWTELPVVMIALDATMHFMDKDGHSHQVSAEEFFKNNARSEFLFTHVTIARNTKSRLSYQRVRKMSEVDQPLLSVCVRVDIADNQIKQARIAINAVVAFAQRDYAAEAFLVGKPIDSSLAISVGSALTNAIYDTRSTPYKQHMFRTCIRKGLEETLN